MLDRRLALRCLALLLATAIPAGPSRAAAPAPARAVPATAKAGFLPDSFILARVHDRSIRVDRFVDAYFASYAPVRPKADSLGRVEFLNAMVNKEVLGLTALQVNRPFGFEDRAAMREHADRVLSNVLFQRAVLDSVVVTDEEVRKFHVQFTREQRFRRICMDDPGAAVAARRQILSKALSWNEAVRRYASPPSATPDGDQGWVKRGTMDPRTAGMVWDLEPGAISQVVNSMDGPCLWQLVERRKVEPPAFEPLRPMLTAQLRDQRASERAARLQAAIARRIGMVYDTTNIRWAAARFHDVQAVKQEGQEVTLNLGHVGGDLESADTARVLARHRDGRFTLGDFVHEYNHQPPMTRQPVGDFDAFRTRLDAFVLEPYMAEEARVRGLERDPLVVAQVERKREELLVEHLFEDSVQSRVWIKPEERRRYYDEHLAQYITYPVARYAAIVRESRAGADSVAARLRKGEKAADVLRADSLGGMVSGSIKETRDEGRGGQYHKILFGELRPGQATVVGPDKEGTWMVVQLLEFDPGRQLPYEQVELLVDESLQNIRAEEMLKALIERLRKRYRIESHPELVMRVHLADPTFR